MLKALTICILMIDEGNCWKCRKTRQDIYIEIDFLLNMCFVCDLLIDYMSKC